MYTTCQLRCVHPLYDNFIGVVLVLTFNFPLYDITGLYDIPSYKLLQYKYLTKGQKVMAVELTTI